MKYLQSGGFQSNPLMRLTLGLALALLAGLWVTNLSLYFSRMTLDPASVVAYYRGNEAEFQPPRSLESMLEVTHMHLPMMALVLLLLTHLVIFAPFSPRAKLTLILTSFLSALGTEAASWLVRFVHPAWAPLKVASFVAFQLTLGLLVFLMGAFLARGNGSAHRVAHRPARAAHAPRHHAHPRADVPERTPRA